MVVPPIIVKEFLEEHFSPIKENESEYIICSPFTKDTKFKCYICKKEDNAGKWIDFKDGGIRRGDFVKFIALYKNISYQQAKEYIVNKMLERGIVTSYFENLNETKNKTFIRLDKDKIPIVPPKECIPAEKHFISLNYLVNKRNLTVDTIKKFSLLYNHHIGYIVLPFFRNNKIVYYTQRNVSSIGMRWNNPKSTNEHYSKADVFFGEQTINCNDVVCLVEGSFDAMLIHQWTNIQVLALNGSTISLNQLDILKQFGFKEIILALDFDEPGINATYNIANAIKSKLGINVKYNHDECLLYEIKKMGKKDWGELDKSTFEKYINGLYEHNKLMQVKQSLMQKLHNVY